MSVETEGRLVFRIVDPDGNYFEIEPSAGTLIVGDTVPASIGKIVLNRCTAEPHELKMLHAWLGAALQEIETLP